MADEFLYDAFISYRHGERDQQIAELLHRSLESYRTPAEVVRKGALPRLTRVFRDQDELQTSSDLSESITTALKQSRYLIVVCSPRAKDSPWVDQEIQRFKSLGRGDSIRALLIEGEPETAFPRSLYAKHSVGHRAAGDTAIWTEETTEPLAADIRASDFKGARRLLKVELLRLLAPLLGCSFDDLRGRHQERARRRLIAVAASLAALVVVFAGIAGYALVQRREAVLEAERAEKALDQQAVQESNRVAVLASELADQGKIRLPLELALQVAPREGGTNQRPLTPSVNALLTRLIRADRSLAYAHVGQNVFSIAATTDEKWVFTGTADGNVQFWRMPGLTLERTIKAQQVIVSGLEVSPDQKSLLVAGSAAPSVWDIASGMKRFDVKLPNTGFSKLAQYSRDGKYILASSNGNRLYMASSENGRIVKDIEGPDYSSARRDALTTAARLGLGGIGKEGVSAQIANTIFQLYGAMADFALSPDGRIVATGGPGDPESAIRLYSLPEGAYLRTLKGDQVNTLGINVMSYGQRLLFSPDGTRLFTIATGLVRSQIQTFDVASGRLMSTFLVPTVRASTMASDANGNILLTGHADGSIVLWCTADGRFVNAFRTHAEEIAALVPSRDGKLFVSTSQGGSAAIWAMPDARQVCAANNDDQDDFRIAAIAPLAVLDGHTSNVHEALILQTTREILTISRDGTVRRWRLDARGVKTLGEESHSDKTARRFGRAKQPSLTFFDNDRKLLLSPAGSEEASTWDLAKAAKLGSFEPGRIVPISDGKVRLFKTPFEPASLSVSTGLPDAGGAIDGLGKYPPYDDSWTVNLPGTRAVGSPAWSAYFDNRDSDAASAENAVPQILDTGSGKSIAALRLGDAVVYTPIFSRDGGTIIGRAKSADLRYSENANGPIILWNAQTGEVLAQTPELQNIRDELLVSDDGRTIVALQLMVGVPFPLYRPHFFTLRGGTLQEFGLTLPLELARGDRSMSAFALSEDGMIFAAATAQGALYAWNVENGQLIGSFRVGSRLIDEIALSRRSDALAAADISGQIFLFDIGERTGSDLPTGIVGTGKRVDDLAFSASGRSLAALLSDETVRLIDVHPLPFQAADATSAVDWAAAQHFGGFSPEDRMKYGLDVSQNAARGDEAHLDDKTLSAIPPETAPTPCDMLAADPYDGQHRAPGVETEAMVRMDAEAACTKALADHPEDATTIYQMGRVLLRAGRLVEAAELLRRAADRNYPAAMSRLALMLQDNPQLPRATLGDPEDLMARAAETGDLVGTLWINADLIRKNDHAAVSRVVRNAMTTGHTDAAGAALLAARGIEAFLAHKHGQPELAMLYYQIGLILTQTMQTQDRDRGRVLTAAHVRLRALAQDLSADQIVAIYRTARDWRMN